MAGGVVDCSIKDIVNGYQRLLNVAGNFHRIRNIVCVTSSTVVGDIAVIKW